MALHLFLYSHFCCRSIVYIASVTYTHSNLSTSQPPYSTNSPNPPSHLQLTRQKLRSSHPKTPILLFVSSHTDHQICSWNIAFLFQSLCQRCIYILFLLCCSSLLEDVDEDEFLGAGEGETGIFEDEFVGFVLGDYLRGREREMLVVGGGGRGR